MRSTFLIKIDSSSVYFCLVRSQRIDSLLYLIHTYMMYHAIFILAFHVFAQNRFHVIRWLILSWLGVQNPPKMFLNTIYPVILISSLHAVYLITRSIQLTWSTQKAPNKIPLYNSKLSSSGSMVNQGTQETCVPLSLVLLWQHIHTDPAVVFIWSLW